jgi:hypothetical protein
LRPAADKPVCCCENIKRVVGACRQHECKHALCNPCGTEAMLGDKNGNGTALVGSRRRAVRVV